MITRRYLIFAIASIAFILAMAASFVGPGRIGRVPEPPPAVQPEKPQVKLVLDFGEGEVATISTTARTAYEALTNVTEVKGIPIKTKQYDFGVFVESIRDVANSQEKAWIYFVNDKAGEVAADKFTLSDGDIVEWRYIELE